MIRKGIVYVLRIKDMESKAKRQFFYPLGEAMLSTKPIRLRGVPLREALFTISLARC